MPKRNPIPTLLAIFTLVWILVLAGTIIIFQFIVPIVIFRSMFDGVLKGVLTTVLVIVWLALFIILRDTMIRRQLSSR